MVLYPYAPSFALDIMDPQYLEVSITAKIFLHGSAKASAVKAARQKADRNAYACVTAAHGPVVSSEAIGAALHID